VHRGHGVREGEVLEDALVEQVEVHVERIPAVMCMQCEVVEAAELTCDSA
jgi:hypothetical protein